MTTTTSACKASKAFYTVVGIYDAKTNIRLGYVDDGRNCRSSFRAVDMAIEKAKHIVLESVACERWCKSYGITASQFGSMLADGVIDPLKSFTFEIEEQRLVTR